MKYIIGNWKCNKQEHEVREWFLSVSKKIAQSPVDLTHLTLVVSPPFVYLPLAKTLLDKLKLPIQLAAQNVSPFSNGAFTGEISASQLIQYVSYTIVGHSERRKNFSETDNAIAQKLKQLRNVGIKPILCIQDENTPIPKGVEIVAYEPVYAIGTGQPETPEKASMVAMMVKKKVAVPVIYGGSVNPDNVSEFLGAPGIDGVLPGGASLEPSSYWEMVINASRIQT